MNKNRTLVTLKIACLLLYGLALAGAAGLYSNALTNTLQVIAGVFIGIHVLELPFALYTLRLVRGSLIIGVLLTLLFGVLHWIPLKHAQKRTVDRPSPIK